MNAQLDQAPYPYLIEETEILYQFLRRDQVTNPSQEITTFIAVIDKDHKRVGLDMRHLMDLAHEEPGMTEEHFMMGMYALGKRFEEFYAAHGMGSTIVGCIFVSEIWMVEHLSKNLRQDVHQAEDLSDQSRSFEYANPEDVRGLLLENPLKGIDLSNPDHRSEGLVISAFSDQGHVVTRLFLTNRDAADNLYLPDIQPYGIPAGLTPEEFFARSPHTHAEFFWRGFLETRQQPDAQ